MTTLTDGFGGQLMLVLVVALGSCALAYQVRSRTLRYGLEPAALVLAAGSGLAVAMVTLTPQADARTAGSVQLVPLATIRGYSWSGGLHDLVIYALGNVALFVPLGFFLYLSLRPVLRELALPSAAVLGSGFSLAVEILQLPIWSRSTDVDDLILNSLGAVGGAAVAAVGFALYQRYRPTPGRPNGPVGGRRYSYQDARQDARQDTRQDGQQKLDQGVGSRAS